MTDGPPVVHAFGVGDAGLLAQQVCGCSSVVEHLLAKERVESSNLFIRLINPSMAYLWLGLIVW